jgi:hypothetical protein
MPVEDVQALPPAALVFPKFLYGPSLGALCAPTSPEREKHLAALQPIHDSLMDAGRVGRPVTMAGFWNHEGFCVRDTVLEQRRIFRRNENVFFSIDD